MILNKKLNDTAKKCCGQKQYTHMRSCETVRQIKSVEIDYLNSSIEKNTRSLVFPQGLDVLRTSRRAKILSDRRRKRRTTTSWSDNLTTIQETHTSCTTQKPKDSS